MEKELGVGGLLLDYLTDSNIKRFTSDYNIPALNIRLYNFPDNLLKKA